ncbi:nucleotide-diphospho-sugar transferase [Rhizodiscina lignyota]|uniref:Nucleotide-diphospho-sugar transferase n=1 Tax=Rhizodiscina lignyota TaxID=1504668 RepID=A0A9P4MBH8_9PEZI|nr:nucleotide-diphospho-sugar transferase [Rhizodiscina lignyota]
MFMSRQSRLAGVLKVLTAAILISYCIIFATRSRLSYDFIDRITSKLPQAPGQQTDPGFSPKLLEFWANFEEALQDTRPSCIVNYKEEPIKVEDQQWVVETLRTEPRPDYITISENDIASTKDAHVRAVKNAQLHASSLDFRPGTRGIATTAGGKYIPVLLVCLRLLRQTGSKLPVEVFLASWSEYDFRTCEQLLPSLNARCRILSDVWSTTPSFETVHTYQFKVFALLYSSFEEVLFLDADAFPLHDPNILFNSEPYKSTGFVTWPDFWANTVHASFYDIASIDPAPPRDLRYTTESGEMLLDKRRHTETLLLATYYNYYGPDCFYRLLSQGASGEGDKETYLHAAMALNTTFWDVKTPVVALGSHLSGEWRGAGMIQHDPMEDYEFEMERRAEREQLDRIGTLIDTLVAQGKANKEKEMPEQSALDSDKTETDKKAETNKKVDTHKKTDTGKKTDAGKKNDAGKKTDTNKKDKSKAPDSKDSEHTDVKKQEGKREDTATPQKKARPFFIHNNNHKLDPRHILDEGYHMTKEDGKYWRLWSDKEWTVKTFGFDLERKVWEAVVVTGCEIDTEICERVKDYWRKVFYEDDQKEKHNRKDVTGEERSKNV